MPILAGLNQRALELLFQQAQRIAVRQSEIITHEGEPGHHMFLIESGSVRVCKNWGEPNETELAHLGPRDFFGEMCILETLPRSATVQTTSDTVVFQISSITFYHLFKGMPDQFGLLILNIARDLSRRLRRLDEVFAARN